MYAAVTIVHIVACLFLIGVVLLQQGKGADMGAVFGGSSQTVFGSSGAGNFLTRMTTAMAVVFMITSLTLAYGSARRVTSTVFDDAPLADSAPADAAAPDAQPAPQADAPADGAAAVEEGATGSSATIVDETSDTQAAGSQAVGVIGAGAEEAAAEAQQAAEGVEEGAEAAAAEAGAAPGEVDPVPPVVP